MALERPVILRLARDPPGLGGILHMIAHGPAGDPVGPALGGKDIIARGKGLQGGEGPHRVFCEEVGEPLRRLGRQRDRRAAHDFGPPDHREVRSAAQHSRGGEGRRHAG